MYVNDPFNQKSSWSVLDLSLYLLQVLVVNCILRLLLKHWLENFLSKLCDALWVSHIKLITEWHVLLDGLFIVINSLSALFSYLFSSLWHGSYCTLDGNDLQLDQWVLLITLVRLWLGGGSRWKLAWLNWRFHSWLIVINMRYWYISFRFFK